MRKKLVAVCLGICMVAGSTALAACQGNAKAGMNTDGEKTLTVSPASTPTKEPTEEVTITETVTIAPTAEATGIPSEGEQGSTAGATDTPSEGEQGSTAGAMGTPAAEVTNSPVAEATSTTKATSTPKPKATSTPAAKPTNAPTPKPTEIPAPVEEFVAINEEQFGSPFCRYIQEEFDKDGDGKLSEEEWEAVTEISYAAAKYLGTADSLEAAGDYSWEIKGLDVFPNLVRVSVDYAKDIELRRCLEVKSFALRLSEDGGDGNRLFTDTGVERISIQDCRMLETIECQKYLDGGLFVSWCGTLTTYTEEEGCTAALQFTETPKLTSYLRNNADGTQTETDISHDRDVTVRRLLGGEGGIVVLDGKNKVVPTPTPAVRPGGMPESAVVKADAAVEKVPVDAAHFSDAVFRAYLLKVYDTDKDGFLSKEEREKLTQLSCGDEGKYSEFLSDVEVFDGLDWFTKLDLISLPTSHVLFLKDHPSIRVVSLAGARGQAWMENCEKLEELSLVMFRGTLYVSNCKNLKHMSGYEITYQGLYFSETPYVVFWDGDTIGWPEEIWLDANAGMDGVNMGSEYDSMRGTGFILDIEDGSATFGGTYKHPVKVHWLDAGDSLTALAADIEKMKAENAEFIGLAEAERVEDGETVTEDGKATKQVYFSNLGSTVKQRAWDDTPETVATVEVSDAKKEFHLENFSLAPVPEDVVVLTVLCSPKGQSVFAVRSGAEVYYTEDGKMNKVGEAYSIHYFVREPDGSLTVYDTYNEALEPLAYKEVGKWQ